MNTNESYNNGEFMAPRYEEPGNGYQDFQSYEDLSGGFESGNAVQASLYQLKSLMFEEVMAKAFLFMVVALLITAFAAYTASPYMLSWLIHNSFGFYILFGAEIAIVLASNAVLKNNHVVVAAILYTIYSYLTGATVGIVCMLYTGRSVAAVFLMTAGMFGVMAIYGMITKRDLSSLGSLFLMGLVGIIIAGVVNIIFLHSSAVDLIISVVGVLIFVGLTAYDVQKLKERVNLSGTASATAVAMAGAFELYLDFINLFLKLLRLFGKRK